MPPQHSTNDKPRERWKSLKEKTTWDWLQLLIVPIILALGGFFLGLASYWIQNRIAEERRQQEVFSTYLDKMGDLLTKEKLRQAKENDNEYILGQARTVTALRQLDQKWRDLLLSFLWEAKLLSIYKQDQPGILRGAHFKGADLSGADFATFDLNGANLGGANLSGTELCDAYLIQANLNGANLSGADLNGALLMGANLSEADLNGANLSGAKLMNYVDYSGANLSSTKGLTPEQVKSARNWKHAIYNDNFRKALGLYPESTP